MQKLEGKVALVTGASRGGGRGISLVLGSEGATVYVTGRSTRSSSTRTDLHDTTIEGTAEQVTARGGIGIPVHCDHTVDADVEALFERIQKEQRRIDILVNNVWGGYEEYDEEAFSRRFWNQPICLWDRMFTAGVRAHYTASRLCAPLMIAQQSGLIVNTTAWDRDKYLANLPYYLAKTAINRMVYGMAIELREYNVAVVALSPGWMRTEDVLKRFSTDEKSWHHVEALKCTESTEYVGRAVAALALDPDTMKKSGRVFMVGDLALEYGFADTDGRVIPPFRMPDENLRD